MEIHDLLRGRSERKAGKPDGQFSLGPYVVSVLEPGLEMSLAFLFVAPHSEQHLRTVPRQNVLLCKRLILHSLDWIVQRMLQANLDQTIMPKTNLP